MKIKTPVTAARVRTHLTYHFWIYLLVIGLAVLGWNLLYTVTAYRPPEDKRIDLYMQSASTSQERVQQFIDPIWQTYVPEMELVNPVLMNASTQDYYGTMQLTVYLMAQEGDLYVLSSSDYKSFASQGTFIDLEPYVSSGRIDATGIDLSAGYVASVDENGNVQSERHLYGIPLYSLYGYMDGMGLDNRDLVISVTIFNGNEDNVITFLNGLIQAGRGDPPAWLNQ